jgi:hypothetical protein
MQERKQLLDLINLDMLMESTQQQKLEEVFRKLCKDTLPFLEDKIFLRRE